MYVWQIADLQCLNVVRDMTEQYGHAAAAAPDGTASKSSSSRLRFNTTRKSSAKEVVW